MFGANNYGFNPYGTYIPPRQMPQPIQQPIEQPVQQAFNSIQSRPSLNGKQVDSIDVVKAMDIPLDGTISYFPIADGSAIVTKQLGLDGVSKTVIYKPSNESKNVKYATFEDMEDLKSDIYNLKEELKEIKRFNKKKED